MVETVLNLQLSGPEIIEAVLDTLREQMKRNCYFAPGSGYDYFSAEVSAKVTLHDTGWVGEAPETVKLTKGTPVEETATEELEFTMEPAPPNEVRVQTGQPVPVETRDSEGKPAIKHVRYKRSDAKKAGAASLLLLFAFGIGVARAQNDTVKKPAPHVALPHPAAAAPELTYSEQVALKAVSDTNQNVSEMMRRAQGQEAAVLADIKKNHPGYHYDTAKNVLDRDPVDEKKQ